MSSTANKSYTIRNEGPDESIQIWRKHGDVWTKIATLGEGDDHEVLCETGDKLKAVDQTDQDTDGASVRWEIIGS